MLNEWSDRTPPGPKRPLLRRGEFWVGLLSAVISVTLAADTLARLLRLFGLI